MPRLNYTFNGYVAPVFTPFNYDKTRSLNLSIIPQYAEYLASRGIPGVLVCGSLGEGPSLTVAERKSVVEAWAKAVKTTKQHLMIQIGGGPMPDVLELARHAESIGADSVLCLAELYFSPTKPQQLVDYLKIVGEAAPKTPLLYYHVPMFTGININMVEFLEAAGDQLPTLVGMKYTSPNIPEALQLYNFNNKEFSIFLGSDQAMASAFALGIDSAIASTLNLLPELAVKILESSKSGDTAVARESQEKLSDFVYAVIKYGDWVPAMKVAMGLVSPFDVGPTRPPLDVIPTENVSAMKQGLKTLGHKLQR